MEVEINAHQNVVGIDGTFAEMMDLFGVVRESRQRFADGGRWLERAIPSGELVSVREAAKRFFGGRRSARWWYMQVESGALPHHRTDTGRVLLDPADCELFAANALGTKRGGGQGPKAKPIPAPTKPIPRVATAKLTPGGFRLFPK